MARLPAVPLLPGEQVDVNVAAPFGAADAIAAVYYSQGRSVAVEVRPCSLLLSQYRLALGVSGAAEAVSVPLLSIRSWRAVVETGAVLEAFRAAVRSAADPSSGGGSSSHQQQQQSSPSSASSPLSSAVSPQRPTVESLYLVTIHSKHAWTHTFAFSAASPMLLRNIKHRLSSSSQIGLITALPAFAVHAATLRGEQQKHQHHQHQQHSDQDRKDGAMWSVEFGWSLLDQRTEFTRQLCLDASAPPPNLSDGSGGGSAGVGLDLRPWYRLENLAAGMADPASYTSSPTYPTVILLPSAVSSAVATAAMAARSRCRLPAISFVHLGTGAVLARASQPLGRSASIASDAALCAALVNDGYTAEKEFPPAEVSSFPAQPQPQQQQQQQLAAVAVAAVKAAPPSLFDDDDDDDSNNGVRRTVGRRVDPVAVAAVASPTALSILTTTSAASASSPSSLPTQPRPSSLMVADCRPYLAAKGNAAFGGGYESGPYYDPFCRTQFFEIDNIFGVSKAFGKLRSLIAKYAGEDARSSGFWRELDDSQWFYHVSRVLACSISVAQSLDRGVSVLVHCTDGWDRTSQCCATAMLMLDPFYRTAVGFCLLIEKEFCAFGHKFAERSEHQVGGRTRYETTAGVSRSDTEVSNNINNNGSNTGPSSPAAAAALGNSNGGGGNGGGSGSSGSSAGGATDMPAHKLQPSPIFTQYMDVVYQIVQQAPHAFEFTTALLAFLSEAVFTCLYGTFLANCAQERRLEGVELGTSSVWTHVLRQLAREKAGEAPLCFLNDRYDSQTAWAHIRRQGSPVGGRTAMLLPSAAPKKMRFWSELYLRCEAAELDDGRANPAMLQRPPVTRVVSWGAAFDDYLQGHVDAACRRRREAEPLLARIEERFAATAAAQQQQQQQRAKGGRRGSEWCSFEEGMCFNCLKVAGLFSSSPRCPDCGQGFCSTCIQSHQCQSRPGG